MLAANPASERPCLESCLRSSYVYTYSSTMKQARVNSIMLLNKHEDMLDPLDLNSVAKAWQIILQFIINAHIKL